MNEHDKHSSDLKVTATPTQAAPSQGRRRLVKGALATPAVMTLMSGRLVAAASSIACAAGTPDTGWLDASGHILTKDTDGTFYYLDSDGTAKVKATPVAPTASCLCSLPI